MTPELRGRAEAVTFIGAYIPTKTQNACNKYALWTALDITVKEVAKHEHMFVVMDANARTVTREKRAIIRTYSLY